ncbi:acetyl/propionyl/methylcrotonyl-CoA carboxylase subunit alpha [Couchioplanes azureus]|uniref:acetyl/propionyl/methylcrotonyl-CoA carboxylase subunit alpha n=1 Tax=Couchioplanes caeruleus TaxID=56438 RepID=UPI00166FC0C8|nr:biotin carboxylase N-terminal domain-containing protein [Couchioplanes caeruleus]GGQ73001.1 acetyl/propionyl-CoA carboxylase subuit alpha [Couchioplanes caeruleus subsp. azureus]
MTDLRPATTITSVLVANRGEIARRVFATCRRRGLATVAVFSDADAGSPHVREADSAVRLPGVTPAETYLRGDLLVEAARRAGADAVHPGYGFLAENAGFARAVIEAGLTWIGPDPETIEVMGSKVAAKERMAAAGVPVLGLLDPDAITEADLPVLVKASAGGGGRGMRIVRTLADLPGAVASAAREAGAAFGDPTVFCERYLEAGHHVEVQIMADAHGTVWALGERECSLQRRHQKVIEEAPSPLVDRIGGDLRERLLAAGRDAAGAVGYRGAGTVEFLADSRGGFWFLEMNTRLQVEHPVTECVTGTDLVALQLDVAAGVALRGPEPAMTGHAVEARLYAESPADDWRPQTGTVVTFDVPGVTARFGPAEDGIRLDSGVEDGSVVGTHYDAMLAKVVAYAPTREAAARRLAAALRRTRVHGVTTNRDLLVASLLHPAFLAGTADTSFYATHPPASLTAGTGLDPALGAVVAALSDAAAGRGPLLRGVTSGFRNIPVGYRSRTYAAGDREIEVRYRFGRDGLEVAGMSGLTLVEAGAATVVLDVDGVRRTWTVGRFDDRVVVDGPQGTAELRRLPRFTDPSAQLPAGTLTAPMPGTVVRVEVKAGDTVVADQPLLWLEAMKMEHVVRAPADGTVTDLPVTVGQQVGQGTTLAVVAGPDD